MLAGATGIDFVLLVVAADDGVMPQTLEHLAIVDLLGIEHGVVALTKADLADAARRADVAAEIAQAAGADTRSPARTIVPVSTVTGEGIDELARNCSSRRPSGTAARAPPGASDWRSTAPSRSPAPARW